MSAAVLVAEGLSKRFGGVHALRGVDIALEPGVVHGLIGPNGAGKSTLVNAITGRVRPDAGATRLRGEPFAPRSPREAIHHGVVSVPQELAVLAEMTVAQVVTLGSEPRRGGFVLDRRARAEARDALDRLGASFDLDREVGTLSPPDQKTVAVAQALHRDAAVVIFDEPTAGMTAEHAGAVIDVVEALKRERIAILYISHRFAEVQRLCDVVTLMRDGARAGQLRGEQITVDALVRSIARQEAEAEREAVAQRPPRAPRAHAGPRRTLLEVEGLAGGRLREVSFAVESGDVLGLAGLPGSGVEEVFAAISGAGRPLAGAVRMRGRPVGSVREALRRGVGYLPPSRAAASLPASSVCDNVVLAALGRAARGGMTTGERELRAAEPVARRVGVPSLTMRMGQLSGGNQQKGLLARLLYAGGEVFVLEDPTVGVDVVARAAVHALLRELTAEGKACVIGSSEPEELVELCDRVLVLRRGTVVAELSGEGMSAEAIVLQMTGGDDAATPRVDDEREETGRT